MTSADKKIEDDPTITIEEPQEADKKMTRHDAIDLVLKLQKARQVFDMLGEIGEPVLKERTSRSFDVLISNLIRLMELGVIDAEAQAKVADLMEEYAGRVGREVAALTRSISQNRSGTD